MNREMWIDALYIAYFSFLSSLSRPPKTAGQLRTEEHTKRSTNDRAMNITLEQIYEMSDAIRVCFVMKEVSPFVKEHLVADSYRVRKPQGYRLQARASRDVRYVANSPEVSRRTIGYMGMIESILGQHRVDIWKNETLVIHQS